MWPVFVTKTWSHPYLLNILRTARIWKFWIRPLLDHTWHHLSKCLSSFSRPTSCMINWIKLYTAFLSDFYSNYIFTLVFSKFLDCNNFQRSSGLHKLSGRECAPGWSKWNKLMEINYQISQTSQDCLRPSALRVLHIRFPPDTPITSPHTMSVYSTHQTHGFFKF